MKTLAVLLAVALLATGCARGEAPLRVLAAASLTEIFTAIAEEFEAAGNPPVELSFAGSQTLVTQLAEGVEADVLATADTETMDRAAADGLVSDASVFATNDLIIVTPAGNPAGISEPADLTQPGVQLVIAAAEAPVGGYTREALTQLGFLDEALANVVSEEEDVKGVVGKVASGEADAGIVYRTDVRPELEARLSPIELGADDVVANYPIATTRSTRRQVAATAFIDFLLSEDGADFLRDAGFGPPP